MFKPLSTQRPTPDVHERFFLKGSSPIIAGGKEPICSSYFRFDAVDVEARTHTDIGWDQKVQGLAAGPGDKMANLAI
jgi:hypothetical protein